MIYTLQSRSLGSIRAAGYLNWFVNWSDVY